MKVLMRCGLGIACVGSLYLVVIEISGALEAWRGSSSLWFPWPAYVYGAVFYAFIALACGYAIARTIDR